jgi:hypothetical protein
MSSCLIGGAVMGKFNSAKSSKLFLESMEEEKNPGRTRFNKLSSRLTRHMKRDEPLTGDVLEFALSSVRDDTIAEKLKRGAPLSDYEKHMIDGLLRMTLAKP